MRPIYRTLLTVLAVIGGFTPLDAHCDFSATATISAQSNVYQNVHSAFPSNKFGFSARPQQVMTFSSVTGSVACNATVTPNGPDGGLSCANETNLSDSEGVSGIKAPKSMFMVGVFTDGSEPAGTAPDKLNFVDKGVDFRSLSPQLNQVFFIGDGLTGDGSGRNQEFYLPATAANLYLGFAEGASFVGTPGFYTDNVGQFVVSFSIRPSTILTPGTVLEDPPDVLVTDSDVTLTLQLFERAQRAAPSVASKKLNLRAAAATKKKLHVDYLVSVFAADGSRIRKKISKKNTLTLKNLPPGNYTTSYRVRAVKDKKKIFSSTESPPTSFTVS